MNLTKINMKRSLLQSFLLAGALLLTPFSAMAQDLGFAAENVSHETNFLSSSLETVIIALFLVAIILIAYVTWKFGKSAFGYLFGYFMFGAVLLGATRLFIYLVDNGSIVISGGSLEFWWHLIFYLAMLMFFMGCRGLVCLASGNAIHESLRKAMNWGFLCIVFVILIFFLAGSVDQSLSQTYVGSPFDAFGLHHFIAVIMAGFVSYYLLSVRTRIGMIGSGVAIPMIGSMALLSLQHLWELIAESWKLVELTDGAIEQGEQFLVLPALILLIVAFMRLKTVMLVMEGKSE